MVQILRVVRRNRLQWRGHVLGKDDDVRKKCVTSEFEGAKHRGWPRKKHEKMLWT